VGKLNVTPTWKNFGIGPAAKIVKSRHRRRDDLRPLYPQKRTSAERIGMSALCQKRTYAILGRAAARLRFAPMSADCFPNL
jgi:hypothetical protein